jgi:hypothetical protein
MPRKVYKPRKKRRKVVKVKRKSYWCVLSHWLTLSNAKIHKADAIEQGIKKNNIIIVRKRMIIGKKVGWRYRVLREIFANEIKEFPCGREQKKEWIDSLERNTDKVEELIEKCEVVV